MNLHDGTIIIIPFLMEKKKFKWHAKIMQTDSGLIFNSTKLKVAHKHTEYSYSGMPFFLQVTIIVKGDKSLLLLKLLGL